MDLIKRKELINILQEVCMNANFKEMDNLVLELPIQYVPNYEEMIGQPIANGGLIAYNGIKYLRKTAGTILADKLPDVTTTDYRAYRDSDTYEWIAQEYILNGFVRTRTVDGVVKYYKYIGEDGSNNNGKPELNKATWEEIANQI